MNMLSLIGWVATAVFACSYFAKTQRGLRAFQAVASLMWIVYGIAIGAMPVIVANVIVAVAAGYSSLRSTESTPENG
ncbi:MAG TPA: YgjV family protein [Terriglobales bacterium]|nr:YgjV family protein [Terriglobales bacterium]